MRLKELEQVLNQVNHSMHSLKYISRHNEYSKLVNINAFKEFLCLIEGSSIYDEQLKVLLKSKLYQTTQDNLTFDEDKEARDIYKISSYLIDSSLALTLVFKKLLPISQDHSIGIKLPKPSDYEGLVKTMSTFQKSISQVIIHKDIEGSLKINSWEFGSFWVDLALGTQAAVTVVSSIAWSAAVISKKMNENKVLEQTIRSMAIKNESLEDILEIQKKMTQTLIDNEANSVYTEHFKETDPEQFQRVKSSIKTFAKLIQDGAEIHPSLVAPEKVQNLFPNYKQLDLIASKIKLLEDNSEEESNDKGN